MTNEQDIFWMQQALHLAKESKKNNEVPVGAVLVLNNEIIGEGCNSPIHLQDPTAHAEIIAIRKGATYLKNYRLPNSTLYITLEPCMMCLGAIIHSRIQRVVYGANDLKYGALSVLGSHIHFNHYPIFESGLLREDCSQILSAFFQKKRLN